METLYDLLGALPRDDAEELRAAFRRAVKGAHPDIHPDDPLAGQKFREIVRANEILCDEEQRAAYDHLLDLAHREQRKEVTAKVMHKAATSVMALVIAAGLGVGGYLGVQYSPVFSSTLRHLAGVALVRPDDFASLSPATVKPQPAPVVQRGPDATTADAKVQKAAADPPPVEQQQTPNVASDAIVPVTVTTVAVAPQAEPDNNAARGDVGAASANVGPPLEISPGDPKVYRERGVSAYRNGDLDGAIAELDRAIRLDPKFSAAYVDRSIVLYRMQKFERAFADIAQAKKLEKASHAAKAAAKKPKPQTTASLGYPYLPRRAETYAATTP